MDDPTNPTHYTKGPIQPIYVIEAWDLNFSEGCILKYLRRYKEKGGVTDLDKLIWYAERLKAGFQKND